MDNIKLFYDFTAQKTADEWYKNTVLQLTIDEFIKLLPAKPGVLDMGCGPGYESMRLHQSGAEVMGIDISTESIKIAVKRNPECRFHVLKFEDIDKRLGYFDGIFASASFIHIKPEDLIPILKKVNSVLKPEGLFEVITQDGEGFKESRLEIEGRTFYRMLHLYTKEKLIDHFKEASFIYLKEGYLDKSILESNWRCYIFKKL